MLYLRSTYYLMLITSKNKQTNFTVANVWPNTGHQSLSKLTHKSNRHSQELKSLWNEYDNPMDVED